MGRRTTTGGSCGAVVVGPTEKLKAGIQGATYQVADALVAAANKAKTDLIVMTSHGRSGIKRLLLGSETQNVLTHSEVPVLVLR